MSSYLCIKKLEVTFQQYLTALFNGEVKRMEPKQLNSEIKPGTESALCLPLLASP